MFYQVAPPLAHFASFKGLRIQVRSMLPCASISLSAVF